MLHRAGHRRVTTALKRPAYTSPPLTTCTSPRMRLPGAGPDAHPMIEASHRTPSRAPPELLIRPRQDSELHRDRARLLSLRLAAINPQAMLAAVWKRRMASSQIFPTWHSRVGTGQPAVGQRRGHVTTQENASLRFLLHPRMAARSAFVMDAADSGRDPGLDRSRPLFQYITATRVLI